MNYSDSISALKAGLMQYSENEKKLTELYKQAIINAEEEFKAATKQLDDQYKRDRNEVHADTVREERNLNNALAARGLGFSGEAAQTKLNSNIILANRLGELTRGKVKAETELQLDLSDKKHSLAMDNAEKLRDIQKGRDNLNASIASIIAEREDNANKLRAEQAMREAELKAKIEMYEAELKAKYGAGTKSENGSSSKADSETDFGYNPGITAKELASRLISTASGGKSSIDGSQAQQYSINKYLLELADKYGASDDYINDLIFILRSHGYEDIGEPKRRIDVITYDSFSYYYDTYDRYYDNYIARGISEELAQREAKKLATSSQLQYIYDNSKNTSEFKNCCKEAGISTTDMQTFLNNIGNNYSPYTNSHGGHTFDTLG